MVGCLLRPHHSRGSGSWIEDMTSPPSLELSICLPCLNEAGTIGRCVSDALAFISAHHIRGEVVVADNGSSDKSALVAEEMGARVVHVPVVGYGSALFGAIAAARGRYIIMADADGTYDLSDLVPFLKKLRAGCDLVVGNRFKGEIQRGAMSWKNRWLGNPILSFIGRLFFRTSVGDFHSGLRGFSRDAFIRMKLRSRGMEFASEMIASAVLKGMRIDEVPIVLRPPLTNRKSHLRPWRDGWRHLRFMLMYSPRWLFFYPGICLLLGSLGLGLRLVAGPLRVGPVTLDVHTLLYCAVGTVVGLQAISFALLARAFAAHEGLLPLGEQGNHIRILGVKPNMSRGLLMVTVGLAGSLLAFSKWDMLGFSDLNPASMLRLVIPSAFAVLAGCQEIFCSFLIGIFQLKTRKSERSDKGDGSSYQSGKIPNNPFRGSNVGGDQAEPGAEDDRKTGTGS